MNERNHEGTEIHVNISIIPMVLFLHSPEPNRILLHSLDKASLGNINSLLFALSVCETRGKSFLSCGFDSTSPIRDLRANRGSLSACDIVLLRIWW